MRARRVVPAVAAGLVALVLTGCEIGPHHRFDVVVGDDVADAEPGDGICEATAGEGDCSLRAAVDEVNALAASTVGPAPSFTVSVETDVTLALPGSWDDANASGDLDIDIGAAAMTIAGGANELDAASLDRAIEVRSGTVTVDALTFVGGRTDHGGGGAIRTEAATTLIVTGSTFDGNEAVMQSGCRVYPAAPGVCDSILVLGGGGAIDAGGPLVVSGSTFVANRALPQFAGCSPSMWDWLACGATWGGAVLARADLVVGASTFDANVIADSGLGGAAIYATGTATVAASTFTDNGSVASRSVVAGTVRGSILAVPACAALTPDGQGNLVGDGTCAPVDARLGPLADNGGRTLTRLPAPGSPAIDAAVPDPDGTCAGTTLDQRGETRPVGAGCDMGAVERQPGDR